MSDDWCVIQKCLTESYELTKMTRCRGRHVSLDFKTSSLDIFRSNTGTYSIS